MGELGSRRYESVDRLIAQLKTQRVDFETYFTLKKKAAVRYRRLELSAVFAVSVAMWVAIGYAAWATLHSIFR